MGLGLINFLFFSAMIYFLAGLAAQLKGQRFGEGPLEFARNFIFTGTGESFRDFITSQNTVVMLLLAISGAVLVGNDFRFRSLTFYFSKPLERWQYFLGKLVATSLLVSLLTLVPCLALFIEYGLFGDTFDYFIESQRILFGILAYGLLVSVGMSILLLGVAALLQRTISIVMVWGLVFIFLPIVTEVLHGTVRGSDYWKLLDFWSLLQWCSNAFFGIESSRCRAERAMSSATVARLRSCTRSASGANPSHKVSISPAIRPVSTQARSRPRPLRTIPTSSHIKRLSACRRSSRSSIPVTGAAGSSSTTPSNSAASERAWAAALRAKTSPSRSELLASLLAP